jgi:hypothetical protein
MTNGMSILKHRSFPFGGLLHFKRLEWSSSFYKVRVQ